MKQTLSAVAICACALVGATAPASGQAEVAAWGNLEGIRVEGERIPVRAGLCALGADGAELARTAKSRQSPRYTNEGGVRTVTTRLAGLAATEVVKEVGPGAATMEVRFTSDSASVSGGGYLCLDLPLGDYAGATASLLGGAGSGARSAVLRASPAGGGDQLRGTARGLRLVTPRRTIDLAFAAPATVVIRDAPRRDEGLRAYVSVLSGPSERGATAANNFTVRVSGEIDHTPVVLALDTAHPGEAFDGIGGNFRLQHPDTDPAVIAYNLARLRVAWGRVEIPWQYWQPAEGRSGIAEAEAGRLDPRVRAAMEMARTLDRRGVPLIASIWFPPEWAVIPPEHPQPRRPTRGSRLDPEKTQAIYASIADYLSYLKTAYGVEPALFSFNEPERGIDVLFSPEEHAAFIRGFGRYLASRGLRTKILLGDNADTYRKEYIVPAMRDSTVRPYIGALSFHSWGGWSEELLAYWSGAARRLGVPLMISEASTDAWAWTYPDIFLEPMYALDEIDLYLRLLTLTQPRAILQWQLTADYSILAGGGVFGDRGELRPTQRFWNLRQLASTPPGVRLLPLTCGNAAIRCAAFGDRERNAYAVHLVNTGAARPATLTGLPAEVKELRVLFTDSRHGMQELAPIPVRDGTARFELGAAGFTTLLHGR